MEGQLQQVVGANLRRLRQRLRCSQESFGEKVGWHRTFVGAVERGERNLTLRTIERLAEQLEVDALALLVDGGTTLEDLVEDIDASDDQASVDQASDDGAGEDAAVDAGPVEAGG